MRAQCTDADVAVQRRIKTVFDTLWLLNAGKVFPLETVASITQATTDEAA